VVNVGLPRALVTELKSLLGDKWVVEEPRAIERYLLDETPLGVRPHPSENVVVVKPGSPEEVSHVVKLANKYRVPVYPRGGGTGLVGGAVPTRAGIILSLERLDKLAIDVDNMVAEAEAGVTLGRLIEEAERHGLTFPPHPGDEGATIGGLVACNAGGSRAVKTGVTRNYVLGLEVVLPTGDFLKLGGKTVKNNMGYNLAHLFIGSEGVLCVIVKAYLRLYPKWRYTATVIVPFNDYAPAFRAARKVLFSGMLPLAAEYFDKRAIELSAKHLGVSWPVGEGEHYLMFIFAEPIEDLLLYQLEVVEKLTRVEGGLEPYVFQREDEQKLVLKVRSEIFSATKASVFDAIDVAVPLGSLEKLVDGIANIGRKYGVWIPIYGHVGDGNLHVDLMFYPGLGVEDLEKIRDEIYRLVLELGGTISGEHGVGYVRKAYVKRVLGDTWVKAMRAVKKALDPNNVLNPDKVIPED